MAEGGADNVWIVEVGDPTVSDSFKEFVSAVTGAEPVVGRDGEGFTVAWTSPTSGDVAFGSTAPFTVDGKQQRLGDYPRHDSNWGTVDRLSTDFRLRSDAASLSLDFDAWTRRIGRR